VLAACRRAQPGVSWEGATARFGAAYIADEVAYAKAAHAALDAFEAFYAGHDTVLLACFGDPGLLALRELSRVPVVGLAQSSFEGAARRGPFAVVTGGRAWAPMMKRFARAHELDHRLVGIHAVDWTGAQIAADPAGARDALVAAARQGVDAGAQCILLGGAALAGLAPSLQPRVAVPVLDNVLLAAQAVAEVQAAELMQSRDNEFEADHSGSERLV
jgi:allantoin racemase